MRVTACIVAMLALLLAGPAAADGTVQSRFFVTSDGVRLHYLESGPRLGHTIVFVPGWTMPAWIWQPQIRAFEPYYHVVAFDPRGQGDSDAPATGYEPGRRSQDIAELIANLDRHRSCWWPGRSGCSTPSPMCGRMAI
jgi:microsomal epoxide hydrolase